MGYSFDSILFDLKKKWNAKQRNSLSPFRTSKKENKIQISVTINKRTLSDVMRSFIHSFNREVMQFRLVEITHEMGWGLYKSISAKTRDADARLQMHARGGILIIHQKRTDRKAKNGR